MLEEGLREVVRAVAGQGVEEASLKEEGGFTSSGSLIGAGEDGGEWFRVDVMSFIRLAGWMCLCTLVGWSMGLGDFAISFLRLSHSVAPQIPQSVRRPPPGVLSFRAPFQGTSLSLEIWSFTR